MPLFTPISYRGHGKRYADLRMKMDYLVFANMLYKYNKKNDSYDECFMLTNEEVKQFINGELFVFEEVTI
jgi:hypothetical protein